MQGGLDCGEQDFVGNCHRDPGGHFEAKAEPVEVD